MLNRFMKRMAPAAALAIGTLVSACDMNVDIQIDDEDGVPLAELDMSGEAPTALALLGPDTVIISEGETLDITVEGDDEAVEALRFNLDDGMLGVMRDSDGWKDKGKATINVTMPAPRELSIGGSGRIDSASMASDAQINIGGAGKVSVAQIEAESLNINIGGSGEIVAAGSAKELEVNIGGSGKAKMPDLHVDDADITIGGSGNLEFSSDGTVDATIAGSGDIRVHGSAKCEMSAFGSGTLVCEERAEASDAGDATEDSASEEPESDDS